MGGPNGDRTMVTEPRLLEFIRRNIRSVWALELLLLLRRAPPRAWSTGELIAELRASEGVVNTVLASFEQGLICHEAGGRVRLGEGIGCVDELCDVLAEAYRERPFSVIGAISSQDDQLASFADAFRLKDGPP